MDYGVLQAYGFMVRNSCELTRWTESASTVFKAREATEISTGGYGTSVLDSSSAYSEQVDFFKFVWIANAIKFFKELSILGTASTLLYFPRPIQVHFSWFIRTLIQVDYYTDKYY